MENQELIGLAVGTLITLMIGSYLLGDNLVYRWGLAILVGLGAGYALGVTLLFVAPLIWQAIQSADPVLRLFYAIPLLLGVLLLLKGFSARLAPLGNITMGFLLGVGAAVAVSGALVGTLIPQMYQTGAALKSTAPIPLVEGGIILIGTITSLLVFSSWAPRRADGQPPRWLTWVQRLGRGFLVVTLAVAFAGAITSALTLLVERLWDVLTLVIQVSQQYFGG